MSLDVLGAKPGEDLFEYCPKLKDIRCFTDYKKDPDPAIDTNQLIAYVVLLYSKDSILNKTKPIEDLPNRRLKAARMAGLDSDNKEVISNLFELSQTYDKVKKTDENGKEYYDEIPRNRISDLISDYVIYQNHWPWADRCATESQMEENIKIRFKPIESNKGDKEIIEADGKKFSLSDHFDVYEEKLRNRDKEIFGDHDDVKGHAVKRRRVTLENQV